jgi:hypothetical protein
MARFPPGKGGGEGVAHGRKGEGILIHSLTDGAGMPSSTRTTPATGDEGAQVLPLLDALYIRTGKRGRPRRRLQVLATDQGYEAKDPRHRLRTRGIRPQIPKRVWKTRKPRGRPLGTHRRLLQRVSRHRHDSYAGPQVNRGINSSAITGQYIPAGNPPPHVRTPVLDPTWSSGGRIAHRLEHIER